MSKKEEIIALNDKKNDEPHLTLYKVSFYLRELNSNMAQQDADWWLQTDKIFKNAGPKPTIEITPVKEHPLEEKNE